MADRYVVEGGSNSAHCCFKASVIDKDQKLPYGDYYVCVCECFELADAERIAALLNAALKNNHTKSNDA